MSKEKPYNFVVDRAEADALIDVAAKKGTIHINGTPTSLAQHQSVTSNDPKEHYDLFYSHDQKYLFEIERHDDWDQASLKISERRRLPFLRIPYWRIVFPQLTWGKNRTAGTK